jgi:GH35 family endo-1,4-beta-xylanase
LAEVVAINEPYLPGHPERALDPFHAVLGRDYLALVTGAVRDAHPSVSTLYNDTLNHASVGVNGITTALTRENLAFLHASGLVDERFRLGVQLHLRVNDLPELSDFQRTLSGYREAFGCQVCVTEFDVDMSGFGGTQAERAARHARITGDYLGAYLGLGAGRSFTVWGIGDAFSYLEMEYGLGDADPTLFDDALQPKPAVAEVAQVLEAVTP